MSKTYKFFSYPDCFDNNENGKLHKSMLYFLKEFDPIEKKYILMENQELDPATLCKIHEREHLHQTENLTKHEYSSIEENLRLVYSDSNLVHNDVLAYHYTKDKIILKYLAIPELSKMFDEDYFNFEWDMHIGQNFNEHRNDYARDHFLHQIRDMYMILIFLDEFHFFEATYEIMKNEHNGKISEFTSTKLKQFLSSTENDVFLNDIAKTVKGNIKAGTYAEKYFMTYVIYASSMLAGLFHDMGYPICHFLEIRHRISEYNPTMHMFTHNAIDSFDQLAAKLSGSLLFTIVSSKEIKQRLQMNKKGKYNHGVYSAIAFLLQFYNKGLIYSLSEEKQCAIELAAVAIYNHTAKYNCVNYKKTNNYYQPIFKQNPISFLLRLCDDLQEWDRRYFEISSDSDLSICQKCCTPTLLHIENHDCSFSEQHKEYKCYCGTTSFRYDSFIRRKIYVVTVADGLYVELDDLNNRTLNIKIDYDLYKLLKMARVNNTYAKYRLNELNELKKLLRNQDFNSQSADKINFKNIYLSYFMTTNPITIKIKLLERYFLTISDNQALFEENIQNANIDDIFSNIQLDKDTALYEYLKNGVFKFYIKLLKLSVECRKQSFGGNFMYSIKEGSTDSKFNRKIYCFLNSTISESSDSFYAETIKILVKDCLEQYSKETPPFSKLDEQFIQSQKYYEQYYQSNGLQSLVNNCVSQYCDKENSFNQYYIHNNTDRKYVGYYGDLYFFDKINKYINKKNHK